MQHFEHGGHPACPGFLAENNRRGKDTGRNDTGRNGDTEHAEYTGPGVLRCPSLRAPDRA
jgi:hypothetical protein